MAISIEKLMKHNPTLIGTVSGIKFYEHPVYGDETGMIAIFNNFAVKTDWFDLPTSHDIDNPYSFMKIYQ